MLIGTELAMPVIEVADDARKMLAAEEGGGAE
jgi:hypothetical protein